MADSRLYYGDNLDILRRYIPSESVDLIYLDPPFKSNQEYNVLFQEQDGTRSAAQIKAFKDTWEWNQAAAEAYEEALEAGGQVTLAMEAFQTLLANTDMLAYLSMMAPRLVELRRVLKPTGSIYLHCDPTASHYLKILMDAVFGPEKFLNEIPWQRTNARSTRGRWPRIHDVLLYYHKARAVTFHPLAVLANPAKLPHTLITGPDGQKYQTYELLGPGTVVEGDSGRPWRGFDPAQHGRHWANSEDEREAWDAEGLIHWPQDQGWPRRRAREPFDESLRTVIVGDLWVDIDRLNQTAKERLGYPTQKPRELLERIIYASSNEGDTILDPFCGCGTTIDAAQRLKRQWIGIDITHIAIGLIKSRLRDAYGDHIKETYKVTGEPTVLSEAEALAKEDTFQFQSWALGLVGARHAGQKRGADKGIDGRLAFHDRKGRKTHHIILSVKSGRLKPDDVRSLLGVVERERAALGVLITLKPPTGPMKADAASAGFYQAVEWNQQRFPRIQILTIADLLTGKEIQYPKGLNVTYRVAPKVRYIEPENQQLAL